MAREGGEVGDELHPAVGAGERFDERLQRRRVGLGQRHDGVLDPVVAWVFERLAHPAEERGEAVGAVGVDPGAVVAEARHRCESVERAAREPVGDPQGGARFPDQHHGAPPHPEEEQQAFARGAQQRHQRQRQQRPAERDGGGEREFARHQERRQHH